jgi:hypothetical protein
MKNFKIASLLIVITLALMSCQEDSATENTVAEIEGDFEFTSLTADNEEIYVGDNAVIKANVIGLGITYTWAATRGDIIGSGSEIRYAAAFCCIGNNTIYCKAEDNEGNTETKEINIYVQ